MGEARYENYQQQFKKQTDIYVVIIKDLRAAEDQWFRADNLGLLCNRQIFWTRLMQECSGWDVP